MRVLRNSTTDCSERGAVRRGDVALRLACRRRLTAGAWAARDKCVGVTTVVDISIHKTIVRYSCTYTVRVNQDIQIINRSNGLEPTT